MAEELGFDSCGRTRSTSSASRASGPGTIAGSRTWSRPLDRSRGQLHRERSGLRQPRVGLWSSSASWSGDGSRGRSATSRRAFRRRRLAALDRGGPLLGASITRAAGTKWSSSWTSTSRKPRSPGSGSSLRCALLRGQIRLARGDVRGAQEDADRALERAEAAKDPQVVWPSLAFVARAVRWRPTVARADAFASELLTSSGRSHGLGIGERLRVATGSRRRARASGEQSELPRTHRESRVKTPWRRAAAAYVSGDFLGLPRTRSAMGALPEEAQARLRAAETFVREGRRAEADEELQRSLAFWRSVGATAYVREGEALLAAAG